MFAELEVVNWMSKLVALGTDGASVNMGEIGGVGAIVKRDIPHLIHIHCIAHELEIAVLDACNKVTYIVKFQNTMKTLLKYYSQSSKRLGELAEIGKMFNETICSFGKWNPIRWIASKSRILKAVNTNWSATVVHLEQQGAGHGDNAAKARGLLREITSVEFIYFLGFMCDFTSSLGRLSEAFQSDTLSLNGALDELDAVLGYLEQLKSSPGHILSGFIKDFDDVNLPTKFRDLRIHGNRNGIDSAIVNVNRLLCGTITYLEKRFTMDGIVSDLDIFDPVNWPTQDTGRSSVVAYGNKELSRILDHFVLLFLETIHEK